jgi:hypothetical protein
MLPVERFQSFSSGRAGVLTHATYSDPTDGQFASQWKTFGAAERAAVLPPTRPVSREGTRAGASALRGARRRGVRARTSQGGDSCSNGQYTYNGFADLHRLLRLRANLSQMPQGDTTRQAVTRGHHAWNNTVNDCGFPNVTNITADYLGAQPPRRSTRTQMVSTWWTSVT